jgi:hypothetical protein
MDKSLDEVGVELQKICATRMQTMIFRSFLLAPGALVVVLVVVEVQEPRLNFLEPLVPTPLHAPPLPALLKPQAQRLRNPPIKSLFPTFQQM